MSQSRHVAATDAPVVAEYLPAAQSRHVAATDAPVVAEYLPAAQSVQTVLPVVAVYLPAVQVTHDPDFPPDIQYVPAAQQMHGGTPPAPGHPFMHPQLSADVLPVNVLVLKAGQDVHS